MVTKYSQNAVSARDSRGFEPIFGLNTSLSSIALNYKGLAYRTEWVEASDIEAVLKPLGVEPNPPTAYAPYTLPAIYDPRTRSTIMESTKIATYLDETYPDTPALLSPTTRVLQHAFLDALNTTVQQPCSMLTLHPCIGKLNPPSQAFWQKKLEGIFGPLEDISPPGSEKRAQQWAAVEKGFETLSSWFNAAGDDRLLLLGGGADGRDSPICHADTVIASYLIHTRFVLGEQSEEWRRVEVLDNGRWKRYLEYAQRWADESH